MMSHSDDQVDEETFLPIKSVAESGKVDSQWDTLQSLLRQRLDNIIDSYQARQETKENQFVEPNVEKFDLKGSREEILELIDSFNEPPFTIQRICELLYSPFKYYDRVSTFLRGLEKNLRVISSNDWPKCPTQKATTGLSEDATSITTTEPTTTSGTQSTSDNNNRIDNDSDNIGAETAIT